MQHLRTTLCRHLALAFVLALGSPNIAICAPDDQIVEELIELSGLKQQIPRLPNQYITFFDQVLMGVERSHPMPK